MTKQPITGLAIPNRNNFDESKLLTLGHKVLELAQQSGAQYSDIRLSTIHHELLILRNGCIASNPSRQSQGAGIRVLVNGAWGFASTPLTFDPKTQLSNLLQTTHKALEIAKAGASAQTNAISLDHLQAHQDTWCTPLIRNPFSVPLQERMELLSSIDEVLRKDPKIKVAQSQLNFLQENQLFLSSIGSHILQQLTRVGAGLEATAVHNGQCQKRSYPMSFGGLYLSGGYELIQGLQLLQHAPRIRDEAIALTTADECPSGTRDLILTPSQLSLQIHESVGHPNELDRVLGWEADFAGRSFNHTKHLREFRYGSDIVNLVADNTLPNGLSTAGYDDDGVPAQRWHVVQNGLFTNYFTTRDSAPRLNQQSNGCNRAEGWSHVPITRIPNLSLMPGQPSLDELIADTKDGVLMDTNKSWSIDQQRLNFQFGCELAYEIKNGKRTRLLRNPNYQDITPRFWQSCDAICNHDHWQLIGIANCGKGQPMQVAEMSHGCSPARFRNVNIGVKSH